MTVEQLLSEGLKQGFAGGTAPQGVQRNGFILESSHFQSPDGGIYHDEWTADRIGGGQELVEKDGEKFTRVYAGGIIAEEELKAMGITKGDIMTYLKKQIIENGDNIRLYENFKSEPSDEWSYTYEVIDQEEGVPTTVGKEIIFYKGELVFVHHFILCPVE